MRWPASSSDPCRPLRPREEEGLRQRMDTLVSTAFPSGSASFSGSEGLQVQAASPWRTPLFQPLGPSTTPWGGLQESWPRGSSYAQGERLKALSADSWSGRRASARGTQRRWRVGVGAADNRDGWLRPLGGGGGLGAQGGGWPLRPRSRDTAEEGGGEPKQRKDLFQTLGLLASLRTHRSASAVSAPRRRRDSAAGTPFLGPS